jgi:hypothetical protein
VNLEGVVEIWTEPVMDVIATSATCLIVIYIKITKLALTYDHRLRRIGLSQPFIQTRVSVQNYSWDLYKSDLRYKFIIILLKYIQDLYFDILFLIFDL